MHGQMQPHSTQSTKGKMWVRTEWYAGGLGKFKYSIKYLETSLECETFCFYFIDKG